MLGAVLTLATALLLGAAVQGMPLLLRLCHIFFADQPDDADALRIGLLGAASIAPHALLFPARALRSAQVVAVGARSPERAARLASRWVIERHGSYADVLADPRVEAVYIPLLNGMHYEAAADALRAGKHVLLEKPMTANAAEAAALARLARERGLVLQEAFHHLHHPLMRRVKELFAEGGELGEVVSLSVTSGLPDARYILSTLGLSLARSDKMKAELGGGKFLSQGCYALSVARHLLGEPTRLISASMVEDSPGSRADVSTIAQLAFGRGVTARLIHSSASPLPTGFNLNATFTRGTLSVTNYLFPFLYHRLALRPAGGDERIERHHADGGASTFELQLRAFVRSVREGAPVLTSAEDGVQNMLWLDAIYEEAGLGRRPSMSMSA